MEIRLAELAHLLGGELTDPERGDVTVSEVRSLDAAGEGDLAFLWDPKYESDARRTEADVVVASEPIEGVTCVVVPDAEAAMLTLLGEVYARRHPPVEAGIHPTAVVADDAELGEGVAVGAGAVVGAGTRVGARSSILARAYVGRNVTIGEDSTVHPNATVLDHVRVGDRVTLHSACVIGKDGFGFRQREGRHVRIPHIGSVTIEDDVEIGALTTVARGAIEDTVIEEGAIVDDHCHIAHGCRVGAFTVIAGRSAMGGSVDIGERCFLLQDSAVSTGLTVGDGAIVGTATRVMYKGVPAGERVGAVSATHPHMTAKRIEATLPKLPDMSKRLRRLEKRVEELSE